MRTEFRIKAEIISEGKLFIITNADVKDYQAYCHLCWTQSVACSSFHTVTAEQQCQQNTAESELELFVSLQAYITGFVVRTKFELQLIFIWRIEIEFNLKLEKTALD